MLDAVRDAIAAEQPVALATLLDGPAAGATMAVREDDCVGSFDGELLDANVARDARGFLDEGRSAIRRYSAKGETMGSDLRVAIRAFATPPRMVVFGAIDFSAALARAATEIGYRVTIVDARQAFAQSPRFAEHAEVVVALAAGVPRAGATLGPRDAILVFTHDPKFDEPALLGALGTRRRLHRRARQPPHPRRPRRSACARPAPTRPRAASARRAGSTSARARPPRPPSPSSPRSSRCAPAAPAAASPRPSGPIHSRPIPAK